MAHFAWKDRFNLHHEVIDAQHRGLLDLLNQLGDLKESSNPEPMSECFHQLCNYALTHFAEEERLFEQTSYPDREAHALEHAQFIRQLLELNQAYEPGDPRLPETAFEFVRVWFFHHILEVDQAYASHITHSRLP